MTKLFLALTVVLIYTNTFAQTKSNKSSIGISIPMIVNNSEATYYALGSPKFPSGSGFSNGININYQQPIFTNIYCKFGIGYFKQSFGIRRPFNYAVPDSSKPGYSTEKYNYKNFNWLVGLGYVKNINAKSTLSGYLCYNNFHSFRQKYIVNKKYKVWQINKKSLSLGSTINFEPGFESAVSDKISIAGNFIIPLYTHWNKDEIFFYSYYTGNEQQIARNKFSAGIAVSCYYHF